MDHDGSQYQADGEPIETRIRQGRVTCVDAIRRCPVDPLTAALARPLLHKPNRNNRSGQLVCYLNRTILFTIDMSIASPLCLEVPFYNAQRTKPRWAVKCPYDNSHGECQAVGFPVSLQRMSAPKLWAIHDTDALRRRALSIYRSNQRRQSITAGAVFVRRRDMEFN